MTTTVFVLCNRGDIKITWDHSDLVARENARKEVESLQSQGYSFFLTSGEPADSVAAGQGELVVKRLTTEEVLAIPDDSSAEPEEKPKKRGRPKGVKADRAVVAVRPLRGG